MPIITSTQLLGPYKLAAYRVRVHSALHEHGHRDAVPRRRPAAGRVRDGADDGRASPTTSASTGPTVRERNLIQPDELPYDQGLIFQDGRPLIYDSGDYPALLAKLKALVGWDEFDGAERAAAAAEGRRVGIGLACYVEGTGVGPYEGGHVQVRDDRQVAGLDRADHAGPGPPDGRSRRSSPTSSACRSRTSRCTTGDTRRFGYAVGTFASRAAVMSGNAVALAAAKVRGQGAADRGRAPGGRPERPGDRRRRWCGSRASPGASIALRTVAVLSNPLRYAFDEAAKAATQFAGSDDAQAAGRRRRRAGAGGTSTTTRPTRSTFATGMHAASWRPTRRPPRSAILRYCVVHDCGTVINPMIVEGQVHGGVAQGVGGALYERMVYDEAGQLQNASFMDFLMPYASEVPDIEIDHLETPSPLNPLGIKGAGEAGRHPGLGGHRLGHRGRRGLPGSSAMPISTERAVRPAAEPVQRKENPHEGLGQPFCRAARDGSGERSTTRPCWRARYPGLRAAGAAARTLRDGVTAGVAAIKGTYEERVALDRPGAPASFTMTRHGSRRTGHGRAPTCGALSPGATGGPAHLRRRRRRRRRDRRRRPADARRGGAEMAGEFFRAIDGHQAGGAASRLTPRATARRVCRDRASRGRIADPVGAAGSCAASSRRRRWSRDRGARRLGHRRAMMEPAARHRIEVRDAGASRQRRSRSRRSGAAHGRAVVAKPRPSASTSSSAASRRPVPSSSSCRSRRRPASRPASPPKSCGTWCASSPAR